MESYTSMLAFYLSGGQSARPEEYSLADLAHDLRGAQIFARITCENGYTLNHPEIGLVQWRMGMYERVTAPYMQVWLNGELIIDAWPEDGTRPNWMEYASVQRVMQSTARKRASESV